jgi:NAD+ synthase (glutamine-hydrolysing)
MSDDAAVPATFFNLTRQGFLRVSVGAPEVRIADPAVNAERIAAMAERAVADGASLLLTPELGLSGYAIDDLHHQDALLDGAEAAIGALARETAALDIVLLVGAPLPCGWRALAQLRRRRCSAGACSAWSPRATCRPIASSTRRAWFAPAAAGRSETIRVADQTAPFGTDLIFEAEDLPGFALAVEICEDVWVPIPPSAQACMAGATLVANLSASNATVGKAAYRKALGEVSSARQLCGYLYSAAGQGESTTDLAWDGHAMIHDLGALLAETERFAPAPQMIMADIDLERLRAERLRATTFAACARVGRTRRRRSAASVSGWGAEREAISA